MAVRLDPLVRILRAAEQRQRQDRGDRGHGGRGLEAARLEELEQLEILALGQLQLPDADPVQAGLGVAPQVVREARPQRRDLGHGDPRRHTDDPFTPFDI